MNAKHLGQHYLDITGIHYYWGIAAALDRCMPASLRLAQGHAQNIRIALDIRIPANIRIVQAEAQAKKQS